MPHGSDHRYTIKRLSNLRNAFSQGFDITTLGLPASLKQQVFPPAFPNVTITGYNVTASIPTSSPAARCARPT